MELNLKDKVALVTGGSRGLGKTICLSLAAEGAKVAVNYRRNTDKAQAVVNEIKNEYGVEAVTVAGDVSKEAYVESIFKQVEEKFSQIDILINNAAVCPTCQVKDLSLIHISEPTRPY